jgi:hypothetical protein
MKVGLPTPMRTPERHSASRFINDERRGWFLCRVSDRNAAMLGLQVSPNPAMEAG